jgi:hypothetical protein
VNEVRVMVGQRGEHGMILGESYSSLTVTSSALLVNQKKNRRGAQLLCGSS